MKRILFAGLFSVFSVWAIAQDNCPEGFSNTETDIKIEQETDQRTLDDVINEAQSQEMNQDTSDASARLEEIEIESETADTSFEYSIEAEDDGSYEKNLNLEVEGNQSNIEVEQNVEMDAASADGKSAVRKGIDYTAHGVKKGVQNAGELAGDAGEVVFDGVTDVGERVGKGVKRSAEYVFQAEEGEDKSRARKGLDYAATGVKNVGEVAVDVGEVAVDGVSDVGERVGKGVYRGSKAVVKGIGNIFDGNNTEATASMESEVTTEASVPVGETEIEYNFEKEVETESNQGIELKTEEELECEVIGTPNN